MFLVHRGKKHLGIWEVAWTWLPMFLAADQLLHRHVDKMMTAQWKGVENPGLMEVRRMHGMVIDIILERYPIEGLRTYLEASMAVQISDGDVPTPPEAKALDVERVAQLRKEAADVEAEEIRIRRIRQEEDDHMTRELQKRGGGGGDEVA